MARGIVVSWPSYGIEPKKTERELKGCRLAAFKSDDDKAGREPSNLRNGDVAAPIADYSLFG